MFKKTVNVLSSLKLTVWILFLIIIFSIPSTLILQHQPDEFYLSLYSRGAGSLILLLGYHHFFSSPLFLVLTAAFWVNLFSCTVKRFKRQLIRGRKGHYGPDILHLGLLVLIIGALVSFYTRQEVFLFMKPGDRMTLPGGYGIVLSDFIYEQYPDGRPKKWESVVLLTREGQSGGEVRRIAVNSPLRKAGLVLYQHSYRSAAEEGRYETGLMITKDPGKIPVIISFFLVTAGLFLTFIQKRKVFS